MAVETFRFVKQTCFLEFPYSADTSACYDNSMKFGTSTQSDMLNKIKFISSLKNASKSYFWTGVLVPNPLFGIALWRS